MNGKRASRLGHDLNAARHALRHARLLAELHGHLYPGFYEIAARLDVHLDTLLAVDLERKKAGLIGYGRHSTGD